MRAFESWYSTLCLLASAHRGAQLCALMSGDSRVVFAPLLSFALTFRVTLTGEFTTRNVVCLDLTLLNLDIPGAS